jgi:hypothetical protein
MMKLAFTRAVAALALVVLLAAGCSQTAARPRLEGTLTIKGKPAGDLTVVLYSEGKRAETFSKNFPVTPEGTFSGDISAPGTYKVVIMPSLATMEGRAPTGAGAPVIPAKYRDKATTDLTWTIEPGDNHKDIDLND